MDFNFNNRTAQQVADRGYDEGLRSYMSRVFGLMAGALGVTGIIAFLTASSPALIQAIYSTPLQWVVMLAPLIFVFVFSLRIHKMSIGAAQACFWAFSAIMGVSMAYIFLAFTGASVARVFFITASVFGAMALYGYTTKRDLTGMGSFLFMGLIGIIIASLVNIFLASSALQFAISVIGVLIFTGLTAYDTQKIKHMYYQIGADQLAKASIMGALNLYLDFINLFVMLLRLVGDRR